MTAAAVRSASIPTFHRTQRSRALKSSIARADDPQHPTLLVFHGSRAWRAIPCKTLQNSLLGLINSLFGAN